MRPAILKMNRGDLSTVFGWEGVGTLSTYLFEQWYHQS